MIDIYIDYEYHPNQAENLSAPAKAEEAMRRSQEEAAETRRKIVKVASRAWRRHGLEGIGIADLMKEAGLTHGGFYKHFSSKNAAVAEALAFAFAESSGTRDRLVAEAPPADRLRVFIETYLSEAHLARPDRGCALAALGAEGARAAPEIRAVLDDAYERLAASAAALLTGDEAARLSRGRALVGAMVGTLIMARTLTDPAAASDLLARARADLRASYAPA